MGNRLAKDSPRYGKQRNLAKEADAREHYEKRASRRPKQIWDEGMWKKQGD